MKKLFLLLISSFLFLNASQTNIDNLLIKAKNQNKHLMFFYWMPGCPLCKKMLNENFKDENLVKTMNENLIVVNINITSKDEVVFDDFIGTQKEFAKKMRVFAVPATQFLDSNGKEIKIIEDETVTENPMKYQPIHGPREIRDYKKYFDYVVNKNYLGTKFDEYSAHWDYENDD